jgi:hypothetical protein
VRTGAFSGPTNAGRPARILFKLISQGASSHVSVGYIWWGDTRMMLSLRKPKMTYINPCCKYALFVMYIFREISEAQSAFQTD